MSISDEHDQDILASRMYLSTSYGLLLKKYNATKKVKVSMVVIYFCACTYPSVNCNKSENEKIFCNVCGGFA